MKTAITLLLCIATTLAFSADVTFNLKDFVNTTQPFQRRTLEIVPKFAPSSNSTNVILSERRYFNLGTNAIVTATNMVDGLYWCYAYGVSVTSRFAVLIPATNGTITAADYVTSIGSGLETENGIPIDLE